ncbi:MAG: alanine--tRNA ligase [Candidatus Aenigmarchaeota archaeon]|nr:alanine--tRNA ligase [Candidatus Aenigmarchaeota archaeon]
MLSKDSLKKEFQKKPGEYWEAGIFREKGFSRKQCKACGKFFWTLDPERQTCADSSCEPYGFIGNPVTKSRLDNVETWRLFEKFFVKEGHTSIPRYPVIDRVRPDLYFTIASIQDFQRIENGNMTFVYPANPLVVPQMCLRFIDIPSVGLSGRHMTGFIMSGQHAFGYPKEGYFKDRCIELNFNFLTKHMGIPQEEIVYAEDIWAMPDLSAFGPSIEAFSKGLELVNHVFMQFQKSGSGYRELDMKVNDTGWGHERLVWFSQGTRTIYDAVFGPVVRDMQKATGVAPDEAIFTEYSRIAGGLDVGEMRDKSQVGRIRKHIADSLGISTQELRDQVEPMKAIYAIADHARSLLFAMADGGIPSNVGGGYNLRVILRRSLGFISEFSFDIDLAEIAALHARFLKPLFPELGAGVETMRMIMPIEGRKYESVLDNARRIAGDIAGKKEKLDEQRLLQLYESQGITPEIISRFARIDVPLDIYAKITEKHESGAKAEAEAEVRERVDVAGMPPTELLFYKDQEMSAFDAEVLKVDGKIVVLDKTCFFAETGGQEADHGHLGGARVYDVKKAGGVVLHYVEDPKFKGGQKISGEIDRERRMQLTKHHTAIHVIHGTSKGVIGSHANQAGTHKSVEKAHIDLTHYKSLEPAELEKLEEAANAVVKKAVPVKKSWYPRAEAEKKFGINIYTGGFIPGKEVRIVEIPGEDVEACGGTHCANTKEIGRIVVVGSERIQDGVDRITIKAGPAAEKFLHANHERLLSIMKTLEFHTGLGITNGITLENSYRLVKEAASAFSVPPEQLESTVSRFIKEIGEMEGELERLSPGQKSLRAHFKGLRIDSPQSLFEHLFGFWKQQRKQLDSLRKGLAESESGRLLKAAKGGRITEESDFDRKTLVEIASTIVKSGGGITAVLYNKAGDVVVMGSKEDSGRLAKEICSKSGGSGGGSRDLGQGKADYARIRKLLG